MRGVILSILAMNLVWQNYQRGGSEKLALLALADWCDDNGGNLYPSIGTVAKKICVSESQARRIIHTFIDDGLLNVVGNHNGGAKNQTRRYRLNLAMLSATTGANATPRIDATPSTDARYPLHGCALPLAPMTPNTSLTIKEPSEGPPYEKSIPKIKSESAPKKCKEETLQVFLDRCKADGVKPIPEDDPIFDYAHAVGLTDAMLALCWFVFKGRYREESKGQKDWRAHFRNAVKRNWYSLWFIGNDGSAALTTAGKQATREMQADGSGP